MTYEIWHEINRLGCEDKLSGRAIGRRLGVARQTVAKALAMSSYQAPMRSKRGSILDPYKGLILGKLEADHELSAQSLHRMVSESGCQASYELVKLYVAELRPRLKPAFRTLSFLPGECAQVDWGSWKSVGVEGVRRRLSFFAMVLCHSRMLYVELTLSQKMEHWLTCHRNAFEFFGGVPEKVVVDNCKTAVLCHPVGSGPVFNPSYVDFARWYGFKPVACAVRKPQEKGRVENGVGYVKKSFFVGRNLDHFEALAGALTDWLENVANVRIHGTTGKRPVELFKEIEQPALSLLPELPFNCGVTIATRADNRFRVSLDGNRYSVPAEYASRHLTLRRHPDRIVLFDGDRRIASHVRSYGRRKDVAHPDHERELLCKRKHARERKLVGELLRLCPGAECYCIKMRESRPAWRDHIRRIVALVGIYGRCAVADAIDDAHRFEAYSSDYIQNILESRARADPEPGPLHLTRKTDLLQLPSPDTNLELYGE